MLLIWGGGKADDPLTDVAIIAEDNRFKDCKAGIGVGAAASVTLRNNQFINVEKPLSISGNHVKQE